MVFVSAAAACAHEADGVGVIHHNQGAVFVGEVADGGEIGEITVHGEYTVRDDQNATRALRFNQLRAEVGHVVVFVAEPLGFTEAHAVDDGGVVEFVGNDGILGAKQRLEQPAVCIKAGRVKNGVLRAEELGELALELLVDFLRAANEAHAG